MILATIQSIDQELRALAAEERRGLVQFLKRLDVLDREHAFPALGCGSAFDYLVRKHHFPEGTAWRRVTAMRLLRRFAALEAELAEGRLNLTQLGILAPHLTEENLGELVRRAQHLTAEQTKELAVSLRPKEVSAAGLRMLPAPPAAASPGTSTVGKATTASGAQAPNGPSSMMVLRNVVEPQPLRTPGGTQPSRPLVPSRLEPVAAGRWRWAIDLDAKLKAELDELRGWLAHKLPGGSLDALFRQLVADSREKHGKRLGYLEPRRPRPIVEKPPTPGKRARIPLPVRRAVLKRDGYRCTEIGADGERCSETEGLEIDHLDPANETGSSRVEDLTTKCRPHNLYRARLRYGLAYVQRRIEAARRAREARRAAKASNVAPKLCEPVAPYGTLADVA